MSTVASIHRKQINYEIEKIPVEYHPVLLKMIRIFNESITLNPAEMGFKQGWQEAINGETYPVSELWEGIDAE